MGSDRAFERERETLDRGAALPETAAGFVTGDFTSGQLRERRLWDEGGPGSEVEQAPSWLGDGWGWLSATSAEWDAVELACRPFKAGYLDAMRGEARRSTDATYTAGYDARIREG